MKMKLVLASLAIGSMVLGTVLALPADEPYRLIGEIKIGGAGQWDYLSVDAASRRLYVTHGTSVAVIDLDKNAVVGEIADTPGVHGFVAVPDLGRGFSSNGRENKSSIVDLKTLMTLSKVDTGGDPDPLLYEPKKQEVYTFNGTGQSATVYNARTGAVVATIPLGGKPETGVADAAANRVYVNNETTSEVKVIDIDTHAVVASWSIAPGQAGTGMAFDSKNHRLFIGTRNSMLVVMDSTNGKVINTVQGGAGIDAAAYDPETGYAFASAGQGATVTISKADATGKFSVIQTLQTTRGARTMALDPKTHNIYLAAVEYPPADPAAPAPAPAAGQRRGGPAAIANSFKVMIFGNGSK